MKRIVKILIVDDEPQNVQVMREILSFHPQYDCKSAISGEDALVVLEKYFPEIILLDVMMPGIDGYEVCRRIRYQNKHKFSKIIMISGMSMIDDRLKGYEAGADDYLTKPYVEDELVAKIEVYSKLNRMEEVDNLKRTALNLLSHETRTPLNGIILGSELLGEMIDLPEKAKQYVELIRESGLRIQDVVEKITRYCYIKDGAEKTISENSLSTVLSGIIRDIHDRRGLSSVVINCECDIKIKFFADWVLLKEAFTFVIDNAVKKASDFDVITINCWKEPGFIIVQVGDQGPGMDASFAERVFDGLFTPDLLHHGQGTGLGLAIAKEIFEEHGGRISCRNRENSGTLYAISIADTMS